MLHVPQEECVYKISTWWGGGAQIQTGDDLMDKGFNSNCQMAVWRTGAGQVNWRKEGRALFRGPLSLGSIK